MDEQTERMYNLMRKESNRLKTFQMYPPWPKEYVDTKKLAKAGFFYAFNGDTVHCAFCRGQVCRWDREDDPMAEHAKHFTTCPFIMGGDVGNEPTGEDPFPGPKRPRPYDVCGAFPDPSHPNSDSNSIDIDTQEVINQGSLVQESSMLDQFNYNYNTNSNFGQELEHSNSEQSSDESSSDYQTSTNVQSSSIISQSSIESGSSNNSSSNSLTGICKICYTNSIELVFLPCGHSVSCLSCAQRLHSCPCCRTTITTRIRTYLV